MVVLTRDDILNGIGKTVDYDSNILNKSVTIRPLTDGEYHQVEALKKDIGSVRAQVNFDNDGNIDLKKAQEKALKSRMKQKTKERLKKQGAEIDLDMKKNEETKYEANLLCASFALSHSGILISKDDLRKAPVGFAEEVAYEAIKISKLDEPEDLEEDLDSFPESEQTPDN